MTEAATSSEMRFRATRSSGEVSAILVRPPDAHGLLVLSHGAGAGMRHRFMESIAGRLAQHGVATFRYQFPYVEQGKRRPDPRPILLATVRAAVTAASEAAGDLPLSAGGKSMGGRMVSMAAAIEPLPHVRGLVFFGFPLHPSGRPSCDRAEHLAQVSVPMLFLQGTRDALAELELLRPICGRLGARAELRVIDGADHSFGVLKRSGRSDDEVLEELAEATSQWAGGLASRHGAPAAP